MHYEDLVQRSQLHEPGFLVGGVFRLVQVVAGNDSVHVLHLHCLLSVHGHWLAVVSPLQLPRRPIACLPYCLFYALSLEKPDATR
jgi:hypothetical protein